VVHTRLHDPKRAGKYGFLYRGVKDRWWWWRCVNFLTSFVLAMQQALSPSIELKTFLSVFVFAVNILGVGLLLPFKNFVDNLQALCVGTVTGVLVLIYLAVLSGASTSNASRWALFYATLAILLSLGLMITLYRLIRCRKRQKAKRVAADSHARRPDGDPDVHVAE